jgi:hypothetical protein
MSDLKQRFASSEHPLTEHHAFIRIIVNQCLKNMQFVRMPVICLEDQWILYFDNLPMWYKYFFYITVNLPSLLLLLHHEKSVFKARWVVHPNLTPFLWIFQRFVQTICSELRVFKVVIFSLTLSSIQQKYFHMFAFPQHHHSQPRQRDMYFLCFKTCGALCNEITRIHVMLLGVFKLMIHLQVQRSTTTCP